jgi:hypothetical protein
MLDTSNKMPFAMTSIYYQVSAAPIDAARCAGLRTSLIAITH